MKVAVFRAQRLEERSSVAAGVDDEQGLLEVVSPFCELLVVLRAEIPDLDSL